MLEVLDLIKSTMSTNDERPLAEIFGVIKEALLRLNMKSPAATRDEPTIDPYAHCGATNRRIGKRAFFLTDVAEMARISETWFDSDWVAGAAVPKPACWR